MNNTNNTENNHSIFEECYIKNLFNGNCKKYSNNNNEFNASLKDQKIEDIKDQIINDSMNELISDILDADKKNLIIEDNNIIFQLTSTENQENNENMNVSKINLGEYEKTLKKEYNIRQNQSLLIFKIDYFQEGSLVPIIGYEIYNPMNLKEKLNLEYCKNSNINLSIPVSINEDDLYKYDPKNE